MHGETKSAAQGGGLDVRSMALYTLRLVLIGFGISKPYWLLVAGFWALKVNYPPPP